MLKVEELKVLKKFLDHHSIYLEKYARLAHYGRRFSAFFPSIADQVNPDRKPWTKRRVSALAEHVATLDPAVFVQLAEARMSPLPRRHGLMRVRPTN